MRLRRAAGKSVRAATIFGVLAVLVSGLAALYPQVPTSSRAQSDRQSPTVACASLDPTWSEIAIDFANLGGTQPGRAIRASDGTVAALVVITEVDENGQPTTFDFSASVRIRSVIIQHGSGAAVVEIDPPERAGTDISAPHGEPISRVALCYRIDVPPPPRAGSPTAVASPAHSPTPPGRAPSPTPSVESYEVGAIQTAQALATEAAGANATTEAVLTAEAEAQATREAERQAATEAAIALATASAAVEATSAAQQTAIAAVSATAAALENNAATRAAELATANAEQTAAAGTIAALQTVVSQPTATPTRPPVIYTADSGTDFSAWPALPEGWTVEEDTLVFDGSRSTEYALPPVQPGSAQDHAVRIEFRISAAPECPTNFGVVVRGSDTGYYAGGIEWNCEPAVHLWTEQLDLAQQSISLDDGWHLLEVTAEGDRITVRLDGNVVIDQQDTGRPSGGQVALWSDGVALEIRRLEIVDLT
ncbi:MAG TPA: family 16 glycoside hydrolase [Thermomicrobiales bacterium]